MAMELKVEGVTKLIRGRTVLDDVSLALSGGAVYGLKGPNGSGKTMLMRAVCGLIRPTSGEIRIDGQLLGRDISFPPSVGILIENPAFIAKYTGLKNLQLIAMIRGVASDAGLRKTLVDVGLDPDDRRSYRKYSLGMKQRLGIAAAIMEEPDLIVLDEPTNALDEDGILLVRDLLQRQKRRGALVVISCHDLAELELLADEIFEMADGRLRPRQEVIR
jgi:ABC-2 type transport system ATP-binding protein